MLTDEEYEEYKRDENHRLNGHFPWTLARRVAFSRWRWVILWLSDDHWWLRESWRVRLLDALFPDDLRITFAGNQ